MKQIVRAAATAFAICCGTISFSAAAEKEEPERIIKYSFATMIIPTDAAVGSKVVGAKEAWFSGIALPDRLVRLSNEVTIPEKRVVMPSGTVLGLAHSDYTIACSLEAQFQFRTGRSRICLVDIDDDGRFDRWFRRGGNLAFTWFTSVISTVDMVEIAHSPFSRVPFQDFSKVQTSRGFVARKENNYLRLCITIDGEVLPECTYGDRSVEITKEYKTADYMGGRFRFRETEQKTIEVECLAVPLPFVLS